MDCNKSAPLLSSNCKGYLSKHGLFENALAFYFGYREGVCIKDQIYVMRNLPDAYSYHKTLNCYVFHVNDLDTVSRIINDIWRDIELSNTTSQERHANNIQPIPSIFSKTVQVIISYMRM
jgi:hypothetical protein